VSSPQTAPASRVFLLGNPDKPEVVQPMERLRRFAAERCTVVGTELSFDGRPAVEAGADRLFVLGGDGTLIGVARSLEQDQIPLVGVNIGKLGFLTEFSVDELMAMFDQVLCDEQLVSHRALLEVRVIHDGTERAAMVAANDCVVHAGQPFRLIRLGVSIDADHLTEIRGDGLIVCTPLGSTAYNLSAGGPIMQAGVDAIVLTPLNPHSITHRPLIIERSAQIDIRTVSINEGTTAIIDGQVVFPLEPGDRLSIRRFSQDLLVVSNPKYTRWHKLVTKLHWGRPVAQE
jgi:NAD+ kinase